MPRIVVWLSAALVLAGVGLSIAASAVRLLRAFASGDPEFAAGLIAEGLVGFVLGLPFVAAQILLAVWAITQLRRGREKFGDADATREIK